MQSCELLLLHSNRKGQGMPVHDGASGWLESLVPQTAAETNGLLRQLLKHVRPKPISKNGLEFHRENEP